MALELAGPIVGLRQAPHRKFLEPLPRCAGRAAPGPIEQTSGVLALLVEALARAGS